MKHTRQLTAILLAALMLTGSVACTDSGDGTATTTGQDTHPAVTASPSPSDTDPETQAETKAETEMEAPKFQVTVGQDSADVVTPAGLTYTLTGYDSIHPEAGTVTFTKGLTVTFAENSFTAKFNRFTVDYTSSHPLQLWLSTGTSAEDSYFLEAGDGAFSGVINDFLKGQYRRKLTSMRLDSCTGEPATLTLSDVTTETVKAPDETCFLENQRFKLGIALHWGGAISYLEDKTCTVEGLTNLVDRHDTGRLIQQSYYGTIGEGSGYEPGVSFGSTWHYNPVQGGDQYGVGGRLIDFQITETSVYIKSQPCDWAKNGSYTPFYTENTYFLEEDFVRVDNRAVDFSGYEHPHHFQELPAMYVVSYLNTFTCYNGDAPWTDGALTTYRNLPFWDHGRQIVYFNEQNTETWYSWYSEEDNFGIGVYVPSLDSVGGGRNEPDVRDKSDVGGSTSFGGGSCILRMKTYQPFEYSYLLTAGSVESMRATFKSNQDFAANSDLDEDCLPQEKPYAPTTVEELTHPDLNKGTSNLFAYHNSTGEYDEEEGALKLTATSGDVGLYINYAILRDNPFYAAENPDMEKAALHTDDYKTFKVEYMIPATNSSDIYSCTVYLCAGDILGPTGGVSEHAGNMPADGQYHVLEINLGANPNWTGEIHQLRFDFFDGYAIGDVIYIKSITLE